MNECYDNKKIYFSLINKILISFYIKYYTELHLKLYYFYRFDFFLVFAKDSYTETDTWMATNLKKRGKNFFFVRTFMDRAIEEAMNDNNMQIKETDEAGNLTEEMKEFMDQEIENVKTYCRQKLKKSKHDDVPIYCISNRHKDRFEFSKLVLDIGEHLPEIQKDAITLSVNIFTEEVFKAKKKILKKKIKYFAGISGAAGAIPFPGVDLLIDIPLIVSTIKFFKQQFNIDYEKDPDGGFLKISLRKIRNKLRSNTENEEDQEILTNRIHFQISKNETEGLSDEFKEKLLYAKSLLHRIVEVSTISYVTAILARYVVVEVLEETTKIAAVATFGILAGVASLIGGTLSFGVTYHLLSSELDKIEKLANEAVKLKIEDMIK